MNIDKQTQRNANNNATSQQTRSASKPLSDEKRMVFVAFLLEATPGELDEIIVGLRKERRAARLAMRKAGAK